MGYHLLGFPGQVCTPPLVRMNLLQTGHLTTFLGSGSGSGLGAGWGFLKRAKTYSQPGVDQITMRGYSQGALCGYDNGWRVG